MASSNEEERPQHHDDDIEEEPPTKKLRSVELDLKIIVGQAPSSQREYWYNAAVMATHSGFIDTLLASSMKESISREIKLPDIEPETWDLAMKYMLDPSEIMAIRLQDAVKIVSLYDKYEFDIGIKVCNAIFEKTLTQAGRDGNDIDGNDIDGNPRMVDLMVEAFVLCDSCNLSEDATQAAFTYFDGILKCPDLRMMFSAEKLQKIIPVFLKAEKKLELHVEECVFQQFTYGLSADDMASPLFARFVREKWEKEACYEDLRNETPSIRVEDTSVTVEGIEVRGTYYAMTDCGDGLYYKKNWGREEPANTIFVIRRMSSGTHGVSGWCLMSGLASVLLSYPLDETRIIPLWCVPKSMGQPLPPEHGWTPVESGPCRGENTPGFTRNQPRTFNPLLFERS